MRGLISVVPTALLSSFRLCRRHCFPHFCRNQDICSLDPRRMSQLVHQSSARIHSADEQMEVRESQLHRSATPSNPRNIPAYQQPLWTRRTATSPPNGCSNLHCSCPLALPLHHMIAQWAWRISWIILFGPGELRLHNQRLLKSA